MSYIFGRVTEQSGSCRTQEGPEHSVITDKSRVVDGGMSIFSSATGQAGAALRTLFLAFSKISPTANRLFVAIVQQERGASDLASRWFGNTFLTMSSD